MIVVMLCEEYNWAVFVPWFGVSSHVFCMEEASYIIDVIFQLQRWTFKVSFKFPFNAYYIMLWFLALRQRLYDICLDLQVHSLSSLKWIIEIIALSKKVQTPNSTFSPAKCLRWRPHCRHTKTGWHLWGCEHALDINVPWSCSHGWCYWPHGAG